MTPPRPGLSRDLLPNEVRSLGILLLIMLLARFGVDPLPRQVPFLAFFDSVGTDAQWITGCAALFLGGAALAISGLAVQAGCLLAGLALVTKVLGNMPSFSNGRLFDGMILLLIGLYVPRYGLRFLRLQCYLLYTGAVLSKVIDPDWWNGRFIEAMFAYHLPESLTVRLSPLTPLFGWLTVATESACAVLLMIPRLRWAGVLTVALFHTALLVLLSEDFGSFYYTVALCATLLFVELPAVERLAAPNARLSLLARHSVFTPLRSAVCQVGPWEVIFKDGVRHYTGKSAALLLALTSLPCLAATVAFIALISRSGHGRTRDLLLAASVAAGFHLFFTGRRTPSLSTESVPPKGRSAWK